MKPETAVEQLRYQGQAITVLTAGLTEEEARFKPDPESWSILEVLNHLVDEEVLDFRRHLGHTLFTPDERWPEIDPEGWVNETHYNESQLAETLQKFKSEREKSIAWLLGLSTPDWDASVSMPWGSLSAGDILASWLAHDLLHLRQIIALRYHLTASQCQPYEVTYAGKW